MSEKKLSFFQSEEYLVSSFVSFLNKTRKNEFEILREYEGGFGRPDLLLYSKPEKLIPKDIESLALINPRLAPLLSQATSKAITNLESLAEAAGASVDSARRILLELSNIGRLTMENPSKTCFNIDPIRRQPFEKIVSIEAKLRDWRRALVQAYRYFQFSNESWVLLDHSTSLSALKHQQRFKDYGIGLATFTTCSELYIHVPATYRPWSDSALGWRTQALLARDLRLT